MCISYAPYDLISGKRILPIMQRRYVIAGGGFLACLVGFGNDRSGQETDIGGACSIVPRFCATRTTASARKSESIFGKPDAVNQGVRASFVRPNGRTAL
jgi:hypothetical protein